MLYNRCMGIYKFGNNTYPRRIRRRSDLGHIFGEKVRFMGREIRFFLKIDLLLRCTNVYMIFPLKLFQIPVYMRRLA